LTAHDHNTEARLISEAKAISGLDHPNIAVIHEIGRMENGQHFIVMACYGGETLKEKISSGPLPIIEALRYTIQIAEGLKRAHEAGIVHRDVKPANVIVTDHGEVKLLDFGLARESDVESDGPGTRAGTPAYMSPEQIRGDAVDHRTDVWSLGVVLYEMLAGSKPFNAGRQPTLLHAILHEQPEPVHVRELAVPAALEAVLQTALAKDPAQRYPDMSAFLIALHLVWPASEYAGTRQP
jgi:serine/threonine protein kinase